MQHLQPNTILQGGKYRIERVLGQGGFGITYLARNTIFDVNVAIKEFFMKDENDRDGSMVTMPNTTKSELFAGQKEKFKKEAKRMFSIKNSHVIGVHDLFEENGTAYYVMDFIDGLSLAEKMEKTGSAIAEKEVREILRQILDALQEVHQKDIWHLDLKPSNIMLDKSGTAYLIDFGASKQIRANGSMTTSTALCYTPGYAPNEQIGQMYDRFGPWTDIYALGATIYNFLTNKKPPMAIDIEEDEEDAFEFPTNISEDMRKLVVWMMQPKRKARPQSVEEVIELIEKQPQEEASLPQMYTGENEETILLNPASKNDKTEPKNQYNLPKEDIVQEEKARTILVVSKGDGKLETNQPPIDELPQRAIKVGDFIFEDGNYSNEQDGKGKSVVGVLFSYFGGTHGRILSPINPSNNFSINGKKLEWHEASIAEWVEIIQNLGHCKVNFSSWEYRFFSNDVRSILINHQIKEIRYATRKSVSGVAYVVNLESCRLTPIDDDNTTLPYIFITEF